MTSSELQEQLNMKAISLHKKMQIKYRSLSKYKMENLATRYCPLYEEVLDTQMYGFSREVDFAVEQGCPRGGRQTACQPARTQFGDPLMRH
ncbi:DUF1507 family protein [Paenibacillus sp. JTLBN-2024]